MPIDKAVILSAGKGSRLLPLTTDRPKCLIELSGKTLLDWQLDVLRAAGISDIVIVTGFRDHLVDAVAAQRRGVRTLFNPFYHVADNLGSVWMARAEFDRDLLLLNGDTLVSAPLLARVLGARTGAIAVTIDKKEDYDSDDMKVLREGNRLRRIGKALEPGAYNAEIDRSARFPGRRAAPLHQPGGADDALLRRNAPLVSARDRRAGAGGRGHSHRLDPRRGMAGGRLSRGCREGGSAYRPLGQRRLSQSTSASICAASSATASLKAGTFGQPASDTVTPQALRSPS